MREARGRAAVCLERVSARPTMPAMPHDRSGASLGKSKISDFEILVVRFGPPLAFLVLSCVQSSPIGGTFRFLMVMEVSGGAVGVASAETNGGGPLGHPVSSRSVSRLSGSQKSIFSGKFIKNLKVPPMGEL